MLVTVFGVLLAVVLFIGAIIALAEFADGKRPHLPKEGMPRAFVQMIGGFVFLAVALLGAAGLRELWELLNR